MQHHRGDVRLPLPQSGMGAVQIAARQLLGQQGHVDGQDLTPDPELGHHGVPGPDHRADRAGQVLVEPGPEVLGGHLAALPLQPVQVQHGVQGRVHLVVRYDTRFDAEAAELTDLGPDALGPGGRQPREQLVHRPGRQLQAHRVGDPPPGTAPPLVHVLHRGAGPHFAEVDQRGAGQGEQPLGQRRRRAVGVLVVDEDVRVVGDRAAEGDQGGQRQRGECEGSGGEQFLAVAYQHDPEPAALAVRQPPRVEPGVALERCGGGAPPVEAGPGGTERGELAFVGAELGVQGVLRADAVVAVVHGSERAGHRCRCASAEVAGPGTAASRGRPRCVAGAPAGAVRRAVHPHLRPPGPSPSARPRTPRWAWWRARTAGARRVCFSRRTSRAG